MTLNSSGAISLAGTTAGQSIEIELGGNGTTMISLNDTAVRTLAGVPSGAIVMPTNFYGKSNRAVISYTFTSSTTNASLVVSSISGYAAGTSDITITNNSGIYLWASATGNYGLNLTGGTTGDTVTLVNNGYIMGCGGDGRANGGSGSAGGPSLNVGIGVNITVNNTNASAYIGGGGGGGSSGQGFNSCFYGGGGGAGGGNGSIWHAGVSCVPAGGAIGSVGANGGGGGCCNGAGGGAGGRIFPGTGGGQQSGGGAGGGGGGCGAGSGGSSNNAGGNRGATYSGGGGGGWGASGGSGTGGGGAGGKAVNLNGKTVTWVSGNTTRVWGTVS